MTRILLVEDDEELSAITAMQLQANGFATACAYDGAQAVEKLQSEKIDLILLDVMLPDTDGQSLCKRIRSEECGYGGPVIFMSCLGDSDNIVEAFRTGGNDYLVKPARIENLLERISANLDAMPDKTTDSRQWFKQFMVDTKSRSVYRVRDGVCGEIIELSRTEYDIPMALIKNPAELLLYRQIYKKVWGQEDWGDVRTLMVHVSNLRKKIDENHTGIIRAIRGVGYLFEDL